MVETEDSSDKLIPAGENNPCHKKHDCQDCHSCQWCSDSKCSMCLSGKAKIKQKKTARQGNDI